jgi:hypothetical protein
LYSFVRTENAVVCAVTDEMDLTATVMAEAAISTTAHVLTILILRFLASTANPRRHGVEAIPTAKGPGGKLCRIAVAAIQFG